MSRETKYEQWLSRNGVPWEYVPKLPLKDINTGASRNNQARLGEKLDGERVIQIAVLVLDGQDMPAFIVYRTADGRYILIDGNHRDAGLREAGAVEHDAYCVLIEDPQILETLTRTANSLEGHGFTTDERVAQAVRLVDECGHTIEQAARWIGIRPDRVKDRLALRDVTDRLRSMGEDRGDLPPSASRILGRLQNNNVLREANLFAQAHRMKTPQINDMVVDVRKGRTEADQLAILAQWGQRQDMIEQKVRGMGRKGTKAETPARSRFLSAISSLKRALPPDITLQDLQCVSPTDIERVRDDWSVISTRMIRLLGQYSTAVPS
jgi:hypothetical protein